MWSAVTVAYLVLAQAPHVRLASPGLRAVNIKEDEVMFYSDHFAQQLTLKGIPVVTNSEIAQLLGLERQKQLMGCESDQGACMSELANALGADGLVTGSIGKFNGQYQINVRVVRLRDAKAVAVYSAQTTSSDRVLGELSRAADEMIGSVLQGFGLKMQSPGFKVWPAVLPVGLGVAGIATGIALFSSASVLDQKLRAATPGSSNDIPLLATAQQMARDENAQQVGGVIALAAGGAAMVAGLVIGIGTNLQAPKIAVAVVPTAGGMVIVGNFP